MTKFKSTKRALLTSALALLVCVSMLIGSTFAWFTDSVTSAGNTIQSGTLKVDLVDANGDSMEGEVIEFVAKDGRAQNEILWEPGCTYETEPVYVVNKGNLALKYEIAINSITGDAKLLEAIEWTVTVGDVKTELADLRGELLANETSAAIVLSGHMKESAGNEYQGLTVDGISISVFATQDTVEYDSFDNQYDDIALVSDATALADAIAAGKNVMLTNDIAVDANNTIVVADDADIVLDLNGYEISGTSSASGKNRALFTVKGEMSVIGNGAVSMVHTGANMEWNNLSAPFSVEAGVLTLGQGVNVMNFGGTDMAYAVDVNTTLGETELNVDGATLYSTYIGVRIFNNHSTAKGVVNYNSGIIYGAKNGYDIWAQLMSEPAENAVVNIADGINYTTEDKSGTMYYIKDDVTFVSTSAGLATALKDGGNITLVADIAVNERIAINNADFVLNGNGHTITMEAGKNISIALFDITGGKATIKDVTFDGIKGGAIVRTVSVEAVIDGITVQNCAHTETQGLLRLIGKSTVMNSTIKNNTCSMVLTLNYDALSDTRQLIKNNVIENNTCSDLAVAYYVKGAGATFDGNKFIGNTAKSSSNAATLYMGFTENNIITNNVFKDNTVTATGTSKRATGGLMVGHATEIKNNAFVGNTIISSVAKGNDVCASVYYTDIDLSGNYWGGGAPVENDNYFVEYPDNNNVIINDYLTTYSN